MVEHTSTTLQTEQGRDKLSAIRWDFFLWPHLPHERLLVLGRRILKIVVSRQVIVEQVLVAVHHTRRPPPIQLGGHRHLVVLIETARRRASVQANWIVTEGVTRRGRKDRLSVSDILPLLSPHRLHRLLKWHLLIVTGRVRVQKHPHLHHHTHASTEAYPHTHGHLLNHVVDVLLLPAEKLLGIVRHHPL